MNIRDLTRRTGIAERQVRYLIAEGFVPAPAGGRATAEYGPEHVAAIQRYARLRDLGFPPAAIRLLLEAGTGAPFPVQPGITLVIDPALLGSGAPAGPAVARIQSLLVELLQEPADAEVDPPSD